MTEKEYRLEMLGQKLSSLLDKRIVLYGTGINSEAILRKFSDLNIMALMDEKHTGQYLFGKKVISQEEAQILGIEVIVIAAEADSAYAVSGRIRSFCIKNHIRLLNMYGYDEIELYNRILEKELKYVQYTGQDLKNQIKKYDVVCFQLIDVLCAYYESNTISLLSANEKKISNNELGSQEQLAIIDKIIPKKELINIVNWSADQGKYIYIISELHIARQYTEKLLRNLGVFKYKSIIQENLLGLTLSKGALRTGLENDFGRKVLYVGTNEKNNLLRPLLYGMDIYLIKKAGDIMSQFSNISDRIDTVGDNVKKDRIEEFIQYTFNSPFVNSTDSIDEKKVFLASEISKDKNDCNKWMPDIFLLPQYTDIKELEILEFPVYESPVVSIIIPAYNQFGYTYNCLKSIQRNTEDVAYEVIVADDCSTDDTRRVEKIVQGIKVIHNQKNLSFLRNCNHVAKFAKGKYLVFLNNDTQVRCNWLLSLVQIMEKDKRVGLVGSKLLFPNGKIQEAGGIIWRDGTAYNYGYGTDSENPECNYVREVDYVTGASIMISKNLWNEIGGFDERYAPAYCEDSDLAFEVRKHNKKVLYQPASEVVHFEGISNGRDTEKGIRAFQGVNIDKLEHKWKKVLEQENHTYEEGLMAVRDRKGTRKTILFVSESIPKYNCDAKSKAIFSYMKLFIKNGYLVKIIPADFMICEPYTSELRQMGIEVIAGLEYKKRIIRWILDNQRFIDYAFLEYTNSVVKLTRAFRITTIRIRFFEYGLNSLKIFRTYGDNAQLIKNLSGYKKIIQTCDSENALWDAIKDEFV